MRLWLALVGVFLLQETVSTNAALYSAYSLGYNPWLIFILFLCMTGVDTLMGYGIGVWLQHSFSHMRFIEKVRSVASRIEQATGRAGRRLSLILLGAIAFPHFNGLVASTLPLSAYESIPLLCLGDLLWFGAEWLVVIGVHTFIPNPVEALVGILLVSVVLIVGGRMLVQRFFSGS
ncbi:MAG: hypothetical protein KGJ34_02575 [Patescibacteria group bacterium]|nr:hypothetical protein [Patescibacteria group bacterium]